MFGWMKKRSARLNPESKWTIAVTDGVIAISDEAGATKSVPLSELTGDANETNDTGPWGADVWWLLFGPEDRLACAFPQGATGDAAAIDILSALPGFDHGEMIKAMGSTVNAVFPVWRRALP
jgi:hypothetical protein